jgi:isopenicillin N synthase-like dioxygenase
VEIPVADAANIPVVDIAVATGDQLVAGLQRNSCVFLTGLESFGPLLDGVLASSRDFFSRPAGEKERVRWSGEGPWQGWQPVYEGGPDALLLERFELALPDPDGYATTAEWASYFGQWPAEPDGMATAWARYYRAMRRLIGTITAMVVDSVGLPAADLLAWTARQHSNLCVNHYLAQVDRPRPGQVRQRPHTDIGGFTLLWADGAAGGLEAQIGPGGEWVPVNFPADAILLQAGDLLRLWTHGRIPANNHRVVNPPRWPGVPPTDRYSVVFFHHPDLDTWVAPTEADVPGIGIGARDHVLARQRAAYQ